MKTFLLFLSAALLLTGCTSLLKKAIPPEGYKEAEVQKVKSVAIIAFELKPYFSSGVAGKVTNATVGSAVATGQAVHSAQPVEHVQAAQVYGALADHLAKTKGWTVLALEKVVNNPTYVSIVRPKLSGYRGQAVALPNNRTYLVKGLANPWNTKYIFSQEDRDQLAKALGVDAVLVMGLRYMTTQDQILGIGAFGQIHLTNTMFFYLFAPGQADPIWFANGYHRKDDENLGRVYGMEDQPLIDKITPGLANETLVAFLKKKPLADD